MGLVVHPLYPLFHQAGSYADSESRCGALCYNMSISCRLQNYREYRYLRRREGQLAVDGKEGFGTWVRLANSITFHFSQYSTIKRQEKGMFTFTL